MSQNTEWENVKDLKKINTLGTPPSTSIRHIHIGIYICGSVLIFSTHRPMSTGISQSVWLADPGVWMTGWASLGKTAVSAFEVSVESWVACRQCPYRRLSALSVISTSQALLSCPHVHCLIQSHRCSAGLVLLYCIWQWPP